MESPESMLTLVFIVCLGLGLIIAILAIFLLTNFDWWDKL